MRQLPLDLVPPAPPTLENFVTGRNAECVAALRRLRDGAREPRFVYLWGESGAGKTHLLQSLCAAGRIGAPPPFDAAHTLYLVDDCQRLNDDDAQALFTLYNRIHAALHPCTLVVCGEQPPRAMPVREDLRTRLGWGLVLQVHRLDDAEMARALELHARSHGATLAPDLVPYLLRHYRRDLRSLVALVDALDRLALVRQRALTLPLLRDYEDELHAEGNGDPARARPASADAPDAAAGDAAAGDGGRRGR